MRVIALVFVLSLLSLPLDAAKEPKPPKPAKIAPPRSPHEQAKIDFRRTHPCPSTGRDAGSCPGYVIGYLTPLACDGPDSPFNMIWRTTEAEKAARKAEKSVCTTSKQ
jgi:hypothetical protein